MTNREKAEQLKELIRTGMNITTRQVSKAKQKRGELYKAIVASGQQEGTEEEREKAISLVNQALGIINAGE